MVPEPLLKERLDVETLDTLGIIPSTKAFNQKYVRTKTKLLYVLYTLNKRLLLLLLLLLLSSLLLLLLLLLLLRVH